MKRIEHFMLSEHTNELYRKEAASSIALTKEVADKINELVDAYNLAFAEHLAKEHEQDGRISKAVLYMKDNLLNSINDLFDTLYKSGSLNHIVNNAVSDSLSTLQKRTSGIISVAEFGTNGKGKTDDTLAFKKAIEYCLKNNTALFVPPGVYNISETLNITGKIHIFGVKSRHTFKGGSGDSRLINKVKNGPLFNVSKVAAFTKTSSDLVEGVNIENISIWGDIDNSNNDVLCAFYLNCYNSYFTNIYIAYHCVGFYLAGCYKTIIKNSDLMYAQVGIACFYTNTNCVLDNVWSQYGSNVTSDMKLTNSTMLSYLNVPDTIPYCGLYLNDADMYLNGFYPEAYVNGIHLVNSSHCYGSNVGIENIANYAFCFAPLSNPGVCKLDNVFLWNSDKFSGAKLVSGAYRCILSIKLRQEWVTNFDMTLSPSRFEFVKVSKSFSEIERDVQIISGVANPTSDLKGYFDDEGYYNVHGVINGGSVVSGEYINLDIPASLETVNIPCGYIIKNGTPTPIFLLGGYPALTYFDGSQITGDLSADNIYLNFKYKVNYV